jgi:hypothetical protein
MADEAHLTIPEAALGKVFHKGTTAGSKEIAIEFRNDDGKIGTLKIGKSYVLWKPRYGKKGYKRGIKALGDWLVETGYQ